jgi:nucleotide-binding universal stress UspA family protein
MAGFRKILIPVDFSAATEIAIRKAFVFLEDYSEIFLLHVARAGYSDAAKKQHHDCSEKLDELKKEIETKRPHVFVKSLILYGHSVESMILEGCNILSPDLIIIGRQGKVKYWSFRKQLSPDRVARKAHCPVLTVRPGSLAKPLRSIVIPIRHIVSDKKLDLAVRLAKKFRARIHLLAFGEADEEASGAFSQPFLKAYRHLRETLQHPVEHCSRPDQHAARATLDYAESVNADMILVDPEEESGIYTWTGIRHISDLISDHSAIQVMEVEPE